MFYSATGWLFAFAFLLSLLGGELRCYGLLQFFDIHAVALGSVRKEVWTRTRGLLRDRQASQLGEAGCTNVRENCRAKRCALRRNSGCLIGSLLAVGDRAAF